MMKTEELKLTQEWDKTFQNSDKVDHSKVRNGSSDCLH